MFANADVGGSSISKILYHLFELKKTSHTYQFYATFLARKNDAVNVNTRKCAHQVYISLL